MPLPTDRFDYALPAHLIAQTPAARRDASRLLVVDRATRTLAHHYFTDLPRFLRPGDVLVRNNAAVLPARLFAQRPTGGAVECFLLRPEPARGANTWWCLIRPGKKLPPGATFSHANDFSAQVLEKTDDGSALVRFSIPSGEPVTALANRLGTIPLPPYIERQGSPEERASDLARYQTVYADRARQVAVAAPTAGLHFTPELLNEITSLGAHTADVTLHVGLGTFKPIMTDTIEEHAIHRELYEIPAATQHALFSTTTHAPRPRCIAVGTTSLRTLEDFFSKNISRFPHDPAPANTTAIPSAHPHIAEADIFIYPPHVFRAADALITNFHQPRSTLLCLVSAFLTPGSTDGIDWLHAIYAEAIAREYRFFSYGDAMLIL